MKRHRKFKILPVINLSEYIPEVRRWWCSLQPPERVDSGGGPLQRQFSGDPDWSLIAKSGPNGFFMFMMALAWWGKSATTAALLGEFDSFIEDVNWALTMVLKGLRGTLEKRSYSDEGDDEDEQPPKKR